MEIFPPGTQLSSGLYTITSVLTRTNNSAVFLGASPRHGEVVIKCLTAPGHEAEIFSCLQHELVVPLLDRFVVDDRQCLVFPYARHGNLATFLRRFKGFGVPEDLARVLIRQMISAVAYIHSRGIIHNDIKLENFLLFDKGEGIARIALADFGGATFGSDVDEGTRTFEYASPEKVRNQPATQKTDIWSFGVTIYALLCGRRPFDAPRSSRRAIAQRIVAASYTFSANPWADLPEAAALVQRMIVVNPDDRISAASALLDPWLL
jgi:serine/threonine protein kinase